MSDVIRSGGFFPNEKKKSVRLEYFEENAKLKNFDLNHICYVGSGKSDKIIESSI